MGNDKLHQSLERMRTKYLTGKVPKDIFHFFRVRDTFKKEERRELENIRKKRLLQVQSFEDERETQRRRLN